MLKFLEILKLGKGINLKAFNNNESFMKFLVAVVILLQLASIWKINKMAKSENNASESSTELLTYEINSTDNEPFKVDENTTINRFNLIDLTEFELTQIKEGKSDKRLYFRKIDNNISYFYTIRLK
jgi:competence protein ComGF